MKFIIKPTFIFALVFASSGAFQTVSAQNAAKLTIMAETKSSAAATQIAVRSDDAKITQMRLISERSGKMQSQTLTLAEAVFIRVELAEGDNRFTILGYDSQSNPDSSTIKSIVIKRISSATGAPPVASDGAGTSSAENNSQAADSNNLAGKRLRVNGDRKIKNKEIYSLEIATDEMETQIGNYIIEIRDEDGNIVRTESRTIVFDEKIQRQKLVQTEAIKLAEGVNNIVVYPKVKGESLTDFAAKIKITCSPCKDETPSPNERVALRSIIGYEQSGASSAKSENHPFLNFFFNAPLRFSRRDESEQTDETAATTTNSGGAAANTKKKEKNPAGVFSVWGDIRLTTTPVQSVGSLVNFTPSAFATNFVQGDSAAKVNDLVRSFDFLVGAEYEIFPPKKLFGGAFPGRTSLSLIASIGAITPLSFDRTAPVFFNVPTTATGAISPGFANYFSDVDFTGKTKVAFIAPDRDRFYRQYYGGLRLKTFFDGERLKDFPATFDFTVGQNEAITTGFHGLIMRLDGSTPLPVGSADFLYLFGSANMKLSRKANETIPPFFLAPATGGNLSDNDTAVISLDRLPFQTRNRDVFRIGVGVDLFRLFKKDEPKK